MSDRQSLDLPLSQVRVVELNDHRSAMAARLLADLGADVLRVHVGIHEPSGDFTTVAGRAHAVGDANKRCLVLDICDPVQRQELLGLIARADAVIESFTPGWLRDQGLDLEALRQENPSLVITSITDFGQTGPYRDWVATDWVHMALNSILSRSGLPDEPPLMPPGSLAEQVAQIQAAWATLVAYWRARTTGVGTTVDLSILEASMQSMDPAFGIAGTASGGVPASDLPPGRPDARHMYPVFECLDGYVRICVLAKRQWQGMFKWLGEPEEFADAKFDQLRQRFSSAATLYPLIAQLFAEKTRGQIVEEGQQLGVPTEAVQSASEVLSTPHFLARRAFVPPGGAPSGVLAPQGFLELEGEKVGIRTPPVATTLAEALTRWTSPTRYEASEEVGNSQRPFAGVRILDLGVIVVGADTARLFADLGADVIKVENRAFPDGSRQSSPIGINASVAWGHRNKRSLGINLRSEEGRGLFLELVAHCDVVMSNFKPGTLESLGLGVDDLRGANPRILMVESSALGRTGPWQGRMGYGPLVRTVTGLSQAWRFPQRADGFCDNITSYPDHTSARVGAIVALASLLARQRDGRSVHASIAQTDVLFSQFFEEFVRESEDPGTFIARGNVGEYDAPYGVYPCLGDDQWCVITVRDDSEWTRLCDAAELTELKSDKVLSSRSGRVAQRDRIDASLAEWTKTLEPREVMVRLQGVGVPAAMMNRVNDLLRDPHLCDRRFFHTLSQSHLGDIPTEGASARYFPEFELLLNSAPLYGEQTREIARDLLELDDDRVRNLFERGVLDELEVS